MQCGIHREAEPVLWANVMLRRPHSVPHCHVAPGATAAQWQCGAAGGGDGFTLVLRVFTVHGAVAFGANRDCRCRHVIELSHTLILPGLDSRQDCPVQWLSAGGVELAVPAWSEFFGGARVQQLVHEGLRGL